MLPRFLDGDADAVGDGGSAKDILLKDGELGVRDGLAVRPLDDVDNTLDRELPVSVLSDKDKA